MSGSTWMDVAGAPLTGYSVTAEPGCASAMTSSGPYQVSAVKLVLPETESCTKESVICGLFVCCQRWRRRSARRRP